MRTRPAFFALTVAVATLTLAGCTAGGGESDTLSYEDSPMAKLFGSDDAEEFDADKAQAESIEQTKKVEELVAECMQKEGFEYTPQKIDESMYSSGDEWKTDDREWVAQYGYGLMNYPGMNDVVTDDAAADPNAGYYETLSESEKAAYDEALNGAAMMAEPVEGESMEYDWETAGCYGSAQHEVYPEMDGPSEDDLAEFDDLMTAMNEMYSQFYDGTTQTEPDKKWAACMSEAGYADFTLQSDAMNSISEKLNVLWEEAPGMDDPSADPEDFQDPAESEEGKAIAAEEIEVALADLECREKTDYTNAQMRLQFEAEEKFIAEHKAELEAYKAAMDALEDK